MYPTTLIIIPARFASSRFPGKPLANIARKFMLQRVWEQCKKVDLPNCKVVVATDDERILKKCQEIGADCVITSSHHVSGTDRCFEAAALFGQEYDIMVNVQGDEPFINPNTIKNLVQSLHQSRSSIGTLKIQFTDHNAVQNPNMVKVVTDLNDDALYFSRSALPFNRDAEISPNYYKHIGVYAFKKGVIPKLQKLKVSGLELAEKLEQLRWLENGFKIHVIETQFVSPAVDTPEDLVAIEKWLITKPEFQ